MLRRNNITHRLKVGKQDIATLDNNIARLKEAMFRDAANQNSPNWASRLDKVVAGINNTPTQPLMDSAPNDVEDNDILQFARKKQGSIDMETNRQLTRDRVNKLVDKGAFRVELKAPIFTRGFKPRYGDQIDTGRDIKGGRVIAESGKQHPLTYVQPVSATSTRATAQAPSQGSAQHSVRARRELLPFANRVHAQFAGQDITFRHAGAFISGLRGFRDATRRANLRQKGTVAAFLRHFADFFTFTSTRGRGAVSVSA